MRKLKGKGLSEESFYASSSLTGFKRVSTLTALILTIPMFIYFIWDKELIVILAFLGFVAIFGIGYFQTVRPLCHLFVDGNTLKVSRNYEELDEISVDQIIDIKKSSVSRAVFGPYQIRYKSEMGLTKKYIFIPNLASKKARNFIDKYKR